MTPLPAAAAAMTKDAMDGLRVLLDAAAPGPWRAVADDGTPAIENDSHWITSTLFCFAPEAQANVALIAAMHEALPGLLDELEALRVEVARLRDRDEINSVAAMAYQPRAEAAESRADALAAENERLRESAIEAVPMNWCDSLLTGPNAGKIPLDCPGVERLLRGIRDRLREALAANPQGATDERA